MNYKNIFILLFILPVLLLSIPGCASSQEGGGIQTKPQQAGGIQTEPQEESSIQAEPASAPESETLPPPPAPPPRGAIIVELSFSEPPVLGKPVEVLATFAIREGYKKDATNTVAQIVLDNGFDLIDGELKWKGDLLRGSSVEIKATIKAIKIGERLVKAGALAYSDDGKAYTGGGTELYAYVSKDSAEVSDIPLGPTIGHGGPAEPPPGWKPPPGYEDVTPEPPSEPPKTEPPAQDVEPVDIQ